MKKCYYCFFKSVYQDMGASWDVCTLYEDLGEATHACKNSENCPNFVNEKKARSIIIEYLKGKSNYDHI